MKQINFRRLAYKSFDKKFSKIYFSTFIIIKAFLIALCLSLFLYLDYFSLHVKILDSLLGICGFYFLLRSSVKEMFFVGFFIGILWFHWISFSFIYYELPYLIPFIILGIGLIYALIFAFIAYLSKAAFMRAIGILVLSFLEVFDFNWLKLELSLINSYFSTNIYAFMIFLALITLLIYCKKYYKFIPLIGFILLAFYPLHVKNELPNIDVKIAKTFLNQDKKWNPFYKQEIIEQNLALINEAIKEKKELIILPESAFPTYLNKEVKLLKKLEKLSYDIAIFTGALTYENRQVLNSSYVFENGKMQIAHKYILVPFGEQIPLPKFARVFINELFFNGAQDYVSAKEPHDFIIKGIRFRNAICFEATKDEIYENNPQYMIAISNNAWFTPSIEPTLQNLLLKYFSQKYGTTIFHSANAGISAIIH